MVYDLARKVVVLVTSGPSQEAGRLQTWTWDGRRWTRRMPTTSPTTRDGALLAYDSSRHVTILYGGLNHDYLTDTWEWNGSNWALRHPDHAPDTSQSGSLAYEPVSHRTLLYQFQHQTWSWDGKDWTQLQPAHVPDLELGNLVFDNTRIILVGGTADGDRTETWGWTGSDWGLLDNGHVPEQSALAPVLDMARGKVVMYGGGPGDDNWIWDGATWLRAHPQHSPGNRLPSALVYDAALTAVIAFVGPDQGTVGSLYAWNGNDWKAIGAGTPPAIVAGTAIVPTTTAEATVRRMVTNTRPVLLPRLPAGVDQAVVTADTTGFSLRAMNDDRTIEITIAVVVPGNSNLGAANKPILFRRDATNYQYIADDPTGWRSIWWMERPGHSSSDFGLKNTSGIPYLISARGLTDAEFLTLAGSLQ